MCKSFHIAVSAAYFLLLFSLFFFLVFELDFGENIDFAMSFVWGGIAGRGAKWKVWS